MKCEEPSAASAGILSGPEIHAQIDAGRIRVSPYEERHLNPASLDLTLGTKVAVYRECIYFAVGGRAYFLREDGSYQNENNEALSFGHPFVSRQMNAQSVGALDSRAKNEVITFDIPEAGWLLKPGIGYLMHTAERIATDDFVPVVDGKSSLGRLFMTAHVTAGYGDPGFDGQYTLEVTVTQPVVIYAGMRFCQIRFHTLVGAERANYRSKGHYQGALATGPVPSMSWKQFEEERMHEG